MQTNYYGQSNKSGVYQIRNLNNGRVYIGSAKLFSGRCQQHLYSLGKGTHYNKFLQNDFNKCGTDAFIFEVLEVVEGDKANRILVEQTKLDQLYDNQDMCYNFQRKAIYVNSGSISNGLLKEETRKKLSDASKRMWQDPTHREKLRRAMKPYRDEQIKNLDKYREQAVKNAAAVNAKHYGKVIDPEGTLFDIANMQKFCDIRNLDRRCMTQVLRGEIPSYYGWRTYAENLVGIPYISNKSHRERRFKLIGPDGAVYDDCNIAAFAKKHNLNKENLSAVIRGKRKRCKGWMLFVESQSIDQDGSEANNQTP